MVPFFSPPLFIARLPDKDAPMAGSVRLRALAWAAERSCQTRLPAAARRAPQIVHWPPPPERVRPDSAALWVCKRSLGVPGCRRGWARVVLSQRGTAGRQGYPEAVTGGRGGHQRGTITAHHRRSRVIAMSERDAHLGGRRGYGTR